MQTIRASLVNYLYKKIDTKNFISLFLILFFGFINIKKILKKDLKTTVDLNWQFCHWQCKFVSFNLQVWIFWVKMFFYNRKQIFYIERKILRYVSYHDTSIVIHTDTENSVPYIIPVIVLRLIFLGIHTYSTLIAIHLRLYFCLKQNLDIFSHRPFVCW